MNKKSKGYIIAIVLTIIAVSLVVYEIKSNRVNLSIFNKEEEVSVKIKDKFKYDNYVSINDDQVRIVISKKDHSPKLANEIMEYVQDLFEDKMYISVKFESGKGQ